MKSSYVQTEVPLRKEYVRISSLDIPYIPIVYLVNDLYKRYVTHYLVISGAVLMLFQTYPYFLPVDFCAMTPSAIKQFKERTGFSLYLEGSHKTFEQVKGAIYK